jgi:hypothetical protein
MEVRENMHNKSWLDALTEGQIIRDWFSLIVHLPLGIAYLIFLVAGYGTSIGLSFILVGIPLLLFMLASTRAVAALDRRLVGAILDTPTREFTDEIDPRGANLGERLGTYIGSGRTWLSLLYLLLKLPLGVMSFTAAWLILPLLAIEVLILGPLTIDMRLISVRMLHWLALGFHRIPGVLLPTGAKRKRDISRLETVEVEEPRYYLDDDGEIMVRKRLS